MIRIVGVRFRTAGKIYFFDPVNFMIKRGDHVVVETARGIEYGTVMSDIREVENDKVVQPLKPVIRIATERDDEQEAANRQKEKEAFRICQEKIRKHGLDMKLIDAEYTFDNNKVLFYFTADGRIDFRDLVKDLAAIFKTRIELRQIGVRDETKIMGGIGICGRPLCCHSYLSDFVPVSIKMAKEQNLSLNPTKISGVCGRLMCCLKNEEETYEELNRRLPNVGDTVTTEDGLKGEVQSVNVLRQLVKVIVNVDDEKEIHEYEVDKLRFRRKHGKKEKVELSREEMQELERLEQEEIEEIDEIALETSGKKPEDRETGGEVRKNRRQGGRRDNNRSEGRREEFSAEREGSRGSAGRRSNRQETSFGEGGGREEAGHRSNRREAALGERTEQRAGAERSVRRDNRRDQSQADNRDNKENRENRPNRDRKNGGKRDGRQQRFKHQDDRAGRKQRGNDNQYSPTETE